MNYCVWLVGEGRPRLLGRVLSTHSTLSEAVRVSLGTPGTEVRLRAFDGAWARMRGAK